jgi:hypothetical protein
MPVKLAIHKHERGFDHIVHTDVKTNWRLSGYLIRLEATWADMLSMRTEA